MVEFHFSFSNVRNTQSVEEEEKMYILDTSVGVLERERNANGWYIHSNIIISLKIGKKIYLSFENE